MENKQGQQTHQLVWKIERVKIKRTPQTQMVNRVKAHCIAQGWVKRPASAEEFGDLAKPQWGDRWICYHGFGWWESQGKNDFLYTCRKRDKNIARGVFEAVVIRDQNPG